MLVSLGVRAPRANVAAWPPLASAMAVAIPCAAILVFFGVRLCDGREPRSPRCGAIWTPAWSGGAANRYAEYQNWRWPDPSADLWYSRRLAQICREQQPNGSFACKPSSRPVWPPNAPPKPLKPNLTLITTWRHSTRARTISCAPSRACAPSISYAPNWYQGALDARSGPAGCSRG
jgi:hypothetical protein